MMKIQATEKASEAAPPRAPAPAPAHVIAYQKLRKLILFGEIAPGQPVTIQGLVDTLGAGMTPVREAIRRLTAEGALEFQGNRRVSVPQLSSGNIDELIFARQVIEPQLVRRAAERITASDLTHLRDIDQRLDAAIEKGDVGAYLELNYRFHSAIYELADAPILLALADGLWLRFGPSLRVVCGRLGTQNLPDQHKEAIDAMAQGQIDVAAEAMRRDAIQGMEQVRRAFTD